MPIENPKKHLILDFFFLILNFLFYDYIASQKRGCFTYSSELSSYNRNNLGCDGSMNSNPHELRPTLLFSYEIQWTHLHLTLSVVHGFKRVTIQIWKESIGPILRVIQILHANRVQLTTNS